MSRRGPRTPAAPHNYDAYASDIDLSGSLHSGELGRPTYDGLANLARTAGALVPQTPGGISMLDDLEGNSPIRPPPMMKSTALDQIAIHNSMKTTRSTARTQAAGPVDSEQGDRQREETPFSEVPTIKANRDDEDDDIAEIVPAQEQAKPGWMKNVLSEAWTTPRENFTQDCSQRTGTSDRPTMMGSFADGTLPSLPSQESSLRQNDFDEIQSTKTEERVSSSRTEQSLEVPEESIRQVEAQGSEVFKYASGTFVINTAGKEADISPWKQYGNGGNMRDIFQEPVENPDQLAKNPGKEDLSVDIMEDFEDFQGADPSIGIDRRRSSDMRRGGTVEMTDLPDVSLVFSQREERDGSPSAGRSNARSESSNIGDTWLHSAPNSINAGKQSRSNSSREAIDDQETRSQSSESDMGRSVEHNDSEQSAAESEQNLAEPPQLTRPQRIFTTTQVTWRKGSKFPVNISVAQELASEAETDNKRVQSHQVRGRMMLEQMKEGLHLSSHDERDSVASGESRHLDPSTRKAMPEKPAEEEFKSSSPPKAQAQLASDNLQRINGPSFSATFRSDPLDTMADRPSLRANNPSTEQPQPAVEQVRSVSDPARNRVQNAREFMRGLREKMLALDTVGPTEKTRGDENVGPIDDNHSDASSQADEALDQSSAVSETPKDSSKTKDRSSADIETHPYQMKTIRPENVMATKQIGQMVFDENLKRWYKAPNVPEVVQASKSSFIPEPPASVSGSSIDAFDDLDSEVRSSSESVKAKSAVELVKEREISNDTQHRNSSNEAVSVVSIHPDSSVSMRKSRTPGETARASGVDASPTQHRSRTSEAKVSRQPLVSLPTGLNVQSQAAVENRKLAAYVPNKDGAVSGPSNPLLVAPQAALLDEVVRPSSTPSPSNGWPRPAIRLGQSDLSIQISGSRGGTPRSVSFSDGRKTGRKIKGLDHVQPRSLLFQEIPKPASTITDEIESVPVTPESRSPSRTSNHDHAAREWSRKSSGEMSVRTKRMEDAVLSLEALHLGPIPPTPAYLSHKSFSLDTSDIDEDLVNRTPRLENGKARRRLSLISMANLQQTPAQWGYRQGPDPSHTQQTMLTNWDFSVAQDRLVECISRIEPYEPFWEHLTTLNLSKQGLESLIRLKEFLPRLEEVDLSGNRLEYLSGLPKTIAKLVVNHNLLNGISSFEHLPNLRYLDVSHNQCDSLLGVGNLPHLQHLCADNNDINSVDALLQLKALSRLSLRFNSLTTVDFGDSDLRNLEILNLASNSITELHNLDMLTSLIFLNLDHNKIVAFKLEQLMTSMKTLRLNSNDMTRFSFTNMPNLRRLYVDENDLEQLEGQESLCHLEQLSVRDQKSTKFSLQLEMLPDLQKLWVSGNAYQESWFFSCHLLNLHLLEMNHCKISELPANFSSNVPNLRILHAQSNFLRQIRSLRGIERLYRIDLVGNQLKGVADISRVLEQLPSLQELDIRSNPVTLSLYSPLIMINSKNGLRADLLETSARLDYNVEYTQLDLSWLKADGRHCRGLNERWSQRRLYYRGMCLEACPLLTTLDGITISNEERDQARSYLEEMVKHHLSRDTHLIDTSHEPTPKQKPRMASNQYGPRRFSTLLQL